MSWDEFTYPKKGLAEEMVWWLKIRTILTEHPSSVLSAHIRVAQTACDFSSKGLATVFWPLQALFLHAHDGGACSLVPGHLDPK